MKLREDEIDQGMVLLCERVARHLKEFPECLPGAVWGEIALGAPWHIELQLDWVASTAHEFWTLVVSDRAVAVIDTHYSRLHHDRIVCGISAIQSSKPGNNKCAEERE